MPPEPTLTIPISTSRLTTTAFGITTLRITPTELRTLLNLAEEAMQRPTPGDPNAPHKRSGATNVI